MDRRPHHDIVRAVFFALEHDASVSPAELAVIRYAASRPEGITDKSIAQDLRMEVGTANSTRFSLCQKGYLAYTVERARTTNVSTAMVFRLSDPAHAIKAQKVQFGIDEKVAAFAELSEVFDLLENNGLTVPSPLLTLAKWLHSKLLMAEKKDRESR